MTLLERAKSLLRTYRSLPKKAFGQNFIIEPSVYEHMVSYASLDKDDTVLDIGAGLGFLTSYVAERCNTVQAIEADPRLSRILREQLSGLPNVKVIQGDVLKADIPPFNKIISTPPYNISSRLLVWMFDRSFECAVLVFQKEFANRLAARIGSRDYGWLTVLSYWHAEAELLDDVPKSMFYPQPKVDSVITRLRLKRLGPGELESKVAFKRLVQVLFAQRNRKVRSAVLPYLKVAQKVSKKDAVRIAETLPFREKRVRELAPEDFGVLVNALGQ